MFRSFTRLLTFGFLLGLAALPGCGGSDGPTNPGNGGGSGFTATIDGQAWQAEPISIAAGGMPAVPGGLLVVGSQTSGGVTRSLTFSLLYIKGPGSYPLGILSDIYGGNGSVGVSGEAWSTPFTGQAGTFTITTLTATHLVADFQFMAEPGRHNPATTNKVVTGGHIDLPLTNPVPALADQFGSSVTATLNGAPYIASSALVTLRGAAGLGFSALDQDYLVSLTLQGVTTPGTYTLQPTGTLRGMTVLHSSASGLPKPAWGLRATDTGSIIVTSVSATRFKGTYNVTLNPQTSNTTGTGPVTLVGAFDIGTP